MAVELYIEDKKADLAGTESLSIDYAIAKIGDIQSRTGARSVQFTLPKTGVNRAIFENPDDVTSVSSIAYRKLKARLYADGIDQRIAFCTLENSGEAYNCRLYGNEVGFYDKIKEAQLNQLNLTAYDYYHTIANVVAKRSNHDVCFPLVYYPAADSTIAVGDIRYMPPAFGVEFLMEQICAQHGYTLQNRVTDNYNGQESVLVLPFTGNTWLRDTNGAKYNSTWHATAQLPEPIAFGIPYVTRCNFALVSDTNRYLDAGVISGWGGRILFPDKLKIDYHLNITVQVMANFFSLAFPMVISIKNGDEEIAKVEVPQADLSAGATYSYTLSGNATIEPQSALDDACVLHVDIAPSVPTVPDPFYVKLISADFTISNVQVEEPYDVYTEPSAKLSRQFCTASSALPAISQSDLLKAYCQLFCAFIQVDEAGKTVTIIAFNDIADGVNQTTDWSHKLDLTDTPVIKTTPESYAQSNTFDWSYDSTFEPELEGFAQGIIPIANTNLDKEFEAVKVPFSASNYITITGHGGILHIPVFDSAGVLAGGADPRLIMMHFNDQTFDYTDNDTTVTIYANLPGSHFFGTPFSLRFENGLLEKFYRQFARVLDNYKQVECKLRLTASDINRLDFTRPVYLRHFNAYFYISTIKGYSPTHPGSSTVELIKLF